MKTYLSNANLITSGQIINGMTVVCEHRKIAEITNFPRKPEKESLQIDVEGDYLCPGFIDIHFHGAMGVDTMDGRSESLQAMSNYCASHGVTSFYPTTWAASPEDILFSINNVKENKDKLSGAQVQGVHVEGPYLNFKYKGAQPENSIRNPKPEEYEMWFESGIVKLITCAPEIPGGMDFIKEATKQNIRISIGHTGASYDQVIKAANCGASQATHLFNGMLGLHHREPGTVGGCLTDDRIYAQIICDGIHLHPAIVKMIIKAKSASKVILITDSIGGAGLPDGTYEEKGLKYTVNDGIARTSEGNLSGSTLTLDAAVRNTISFTGMKIEEVVSMVTSNPATEMGIANSKGFVKVGYDADLVLLNKKLFVDKTIIAGKLVYSKQ